MYLVAHVIMVTRAQDLVIIHLGCQLLDTSARPTRTTGLETGRSYLRVVPIRFCSRWGLPCQHHCWRCGRLLPYPFTLTPSRNPKRFTFCGTFPWVRPKASPAGCYPASCIHGARTFLHCALSRPAAAITRPTDTTTYMPSMTCRQQKDVFSV